MPNLREQLQQLFRGRVCLMGLGNVDYGDDGFGVRLVEALVRSERGELGREFLSSGDSNAAFPLTPALSLGERENHFPRGDISKCPGFTRRRGARLPLSKGEGWGEGEGISETGGRLSSVSIVRNPYSKPSAGNNNGVSDLGLPFSIINAGTTPERLIGRVADAGFNHVVFLDAVEFGGAPGSVVLLTSDEVAARYPQISTHKISLGLLAKWAEANGTTQAWLLGVQPESLRPGEELTPAVRATFELMLDLLRGCLRTARLGGRASSRAQTSLDSSGSQGSRGRSPSQPAEVMV